MCLNIWQFSVSCEVLCRRHPHAGLYSGWPQDIIVISDVVLLFTKMPIREALGLLGRHFGEDIVRLFCHFLNSSVVSCEKRQHRHKVASASGDCRLFMEDFEEVMVLLRSWHFVMWLQGSEKPKGCLAT
jgi:hypothetical protein